MYTGLNPIDGRADMAVFVCTYTHDDHHFHRPTPVSPCQHPAEMLVTFLRKGMGLCLPLRCLIPRYLFIFFSSHRSQVDFNSPKIQGYFQKTHSYFQSSKNLPEAGKQCCELVSGPGFVSLETVTSPIGRLTARAYSQGLP